MSYESWRISFQSSEQAARTAYDELDTIRAELVGAIKARNAAIMLYNSARQYRDDLLIQRHEWCGALATLEGEREANALLTEENERLRTALTISTNGLRHCSRWNISNEKEKALMAVVMENETILKTHNVEVRRGPATEGETK